MIIEIIAHALHCHFVCAVKARVGNRVESNHIDATIQGSQEFNQGFGMLYRIVDAFEDDVFKSKSALLCAFCVVLVGLAAEIILTQQLHHIFNAKSTFGRHHRFALIWQRMVERNRKRTVAFIEETNQTFGNSHGRHRDALWTPAISPFGSHGFGGAEHILYVVHRLTLTHKDDVGELFALRERINLVENVGSCEVCHEALSASHAKFTSHLAAHLRGHAERSAFPVRDVHCFDIVSALCFVEIFDGTIFRFHAFYRSRDANLVVFCELLSCSLGEISHLVKGARMLVVEPTTDLFSHKFG